MVTEAAVKRTYTVGGVEFQREEKRLRFRLSWGTLLLQTALNLLLIPFIGYALALPWLEPHRPVGFPVEPGSFFLGVFIEIVLCIFLVARIMDRARPYTLDLRDRTFRHGSRPVASLDDILTLSVIQRNRACSLEFTLRPDARTVSALRLPALKGAGDAIKEIAQFLGMET